MIRRTVLFLIAAFIFCGYLYPQKLYFCEDYKDGKEIAVSDVFIIKPNGGYFTCMVDLRGTGSKIGTSKIILRIVKYENVTEKFIADEKFDVESDWDYIYFDKFHIFNSEGRYKVTALKPDYTPIASGDVTIEISTVDDDDEILTTKSDSKLYFCEKYDTKEFGVSDLFYVSVIGGGSFTAMLDIRGTGTTVNADKMNLKIYKLDGNDEIFIADEKFDINKEWDYIYFADFHVFKNAGRYRVKAFKPDGTIIAFGDVSIRVR